MIGDEDEITQPSPSWRLQLEQRTARLEREFDTLADEHNNEVLAHNTRRRRFRNALRAAAVAGVGVLYFALLGASGLALYELVELEHPRAPGKVSCSTP